MTYIAHVTRLDNNSFQKQFFQQTTKDIPMAVG